VYVKAFTCSKLNLEPARVGTPYARCVAGLGMTYTPRRPQHKPLFLPVGEIEERITMA